jgi:hypothetical protein
MRDHATVAAMHASVLLVEAKEHQSGPFKDHIAIFPELLP